MVLLCGVVSLRPKLAQEESLCSNPEPAVTHLASPSLSPADPDPATPVDLKDEVEPKEEEEKLVGAALERFAIVPPRGRARIEVRLSFSLNSTQDP